MEQASRFDCPSVGLTLKALLQSTRKVLGITLAGAVAIHSALALVQGLGEEEHTSKPLTTKFIKRAPKLTKPLELRKRPRPKRRQIQRRMVSVKAKARREAISSFVQPVHVVARLARPSVHVGRSVSFEEGSAEPEVLAEAIEGTQRPQNRIDMALEMMDIEAMDTGEYHAMVIQDPTDKQNITGFFHFVVGYSKTMRHVYAPDWDECEERQLYALKRLANYIDECSDIRTDVTGVNVPLDSDDILKVPWTYLGTPWPFQLTVSELQHLGRYLVGGGFLFGEAMYCSDSPSPGYASFVNMFTEALAYEGIRVRALERIPNSHSIYHCYFDFHGGPPMAGDHLNISSYPKRGSYPYLEGLFLEGGRMVGILSQKWYANAWGDWGTGGYKGAGYKNLDPIRPLQFGVNLIIFALTQEGSITHRLMESVQ